VAKKAAVTSVKVGILPETAFLADHCGPFSLPDSLPGNQQPFIIDIPFGTLVQTVAEQVEQITGGDEQGSSHLLYTGNGKQIGIDIGQGLLHHWGQDALLPDGSRNGQAQINKQLVQSQSEDLFEGLPICLVVVIVKAMKNIRCHGVAGKIQDLQPCLQTVYGGYAVQLGIEQNIVALVGRCGIDTQKMVFGRLDDHQVAGMEVVLPSLDPVSHIPGYQIDQLVHAVTVYLSQDSGWETFCNMLVAKGIVI